jgi:hypothetical protein
MFCISQLFLHYTGSSDYSLSMGTLLSGIVVYSALYVFILFYHPDLLQLWSYYGIYFVAIDIIITFCLHLLSKNSQTNGLDEVLDDLDSSDDYDSDPEEESNVPDVSDFSVSDSDSSESDSEDSELPVPKPTTEQPAPPSPILVPTPVLESLSPV